MKRLGLLVMPLMAVSLLVSCGGSKEPIKFSYTLTYTYDNGTTDKYVETYDEDKKTVEPTWVPENPGYTFDGWFTKSGKEGGLFTFGAELTSDTVVFAHWSKKPTYTITFKNDDDPDRKIENITAGSIVSEIVPEPITPKPDSVFIGWCTDTDGKSVFDFDTVKIYQDYTLYAGWESQTVKRTVSFNIVGCKMYYGNTEIKSSGTKIEIPDADPCYVKFSVKAADNIYLKPSDVVLDKAFDYSFYKESGDLYINLQSDVSISGTCDMYKTLEECSWSAINQALLDGIAFKAFKVGDEKKITLLENGAEQSFTHTVRIIGFNHDDLAVSSDKAGITFEFVNLITDSNGNAVTKHWNNEQSQSSTNYDYRESTLNNFLNDTGDNDSIINMLPDDLKTLIKQVDKKVGVNETATAGSQYYTAISFDGEEHPYPYLFPLAYNELHNLNDAYVTPNETNGIYEYYSYYGDDEAVDNAYRVKKTVSGKGEKYWLRSPSTHSSFWAWDIDATGRFETEEVYWDPYAIAPAFCI